MIDLDSVDAFNASLQRIEPKGSGVGQLPKCKKARRTKSKRGKAMADAPAMSDVKFVVEETDFLS
jgi:hypothetical protein